VQARKTELEELLKAVGRARAEVAALAHSRAQLEDEVAVLELRKAPSMYLMYSCGDVSNAAATSAASNSRSCYALKQGYSFYHDILPQDSPRPHWCRASLGLKFLKQSTLSVDTFFYMDTDVYILDPAVRLERFVALAERACVLTLKEALSGPCCDIIVQDNPHIVNTGVVAFRRSNFSRAFLQEWLADQSLGDAWVFDQGPFQNIILRHAARHVGAAYTDECWHVSRTKSPHDANMCYAAHMDRFGLPYRARTFPHVCFLDPDQPSSRLNVPEHNIGDFALHAKDTRNLPPYRC